MKKVFWGSVILLAVAASLISIFDKNIINLIKSHSKVDRTGIQYSFRTGEYYPQILEEQGYPFENITEIYGSEKHSMLFATQSGEGEAWGGGLWVSHDEGKTWARSDNGIRDPSMPIYQFIEDEKRGFIYIATLDGVYRSSNAGKSWNRFSASLPYEDRDDITTYVMKLSIDPATGEVYLLMGNAGLGIYKTGYKNPEWQEIGLGLPDDSLTHALEFSPADNLLYVANGHSGAIVIGGINQCTKGIWVAYESDKHLRWKKVELPFRVEKYEPARSLTADPNTGELYACTIKGLYKRVVDDWQLELDEDFMGWITFEKGPKRRAIAGTADKLYLRSEGKWKPLNNTPWDEYASIGGICFFKDKIYVGTIYGLFVSRDNGGSWERILDKRLNNS